MYSKESNNILVLLKCFIIQRKIIVMISILTKIIHLRHSSINVFYVDNFCLFLIINESVKNGFISYNLNHMVVFILFVLFFFRFRETNSIFIDTQEITIKIDHLNNPNKIQ